MASDLSFTQPRRPVLAAWHLAATCSLVDHSGAGLCSTRPPTPAECSVVGRAAHDWTAQFSIQCVRSHICRASALHRPVVETAEHAQAVLAVGKSVGHLQDNPSPVRKSHAATAQSPCSPPHTRPPLEYSCGLAVICLPGRNYRDCLSRSIFRTSTGQRPTVV
jgi:hypothetical protein